MRSGIRLCLLLAAPGVVATACLEEIEDDLPAPTQQPAVDSGPGTSGCEGQCCPTAAECFPNGDPTAPGSECLALRDNRGQDKIQLATVWRRNFLPVATTADVTYGFLLQRSSLPMPQCNQRGLSGFIQLFEWTRYANGTELPIAEQTVRTGFAAWTEDSNEILTQGFCFLDFMHTDPPWRTTPRRVFATNAQRVESDFDVTDQAFRESILAGDEGVFYFDEATGRTHGFGPRGWVVIYENKDDLMAIPIHEVETFGQMNSPDVMNCAGRYRGDVLDPNTATPCQAASQSEPPYGCIDDQCPAGEGPGRTLGYFLVEELEDVHNSILNMTLCVNYMGQERAVSEGWADPADWGLNCRGSPKWKAGERPRGDWCSKTNGPADAACADAWRSDSQGALAAMPMREGTCETTAK